MKKLRAFTLIELLVGMILSAIVIGFGYGAYGIMIQRFNSHKLVKARISDQIHFRSVLANDIFESESLLYNERELLLKGKSRLKYIFADSCVVRQTGDQADTFGLAVGEIVVKYTGSPRSLVRSVDFNSNSNGEMQYFFFNKDYDAITLIKSESQKDE